MSNDFRHYPLGFTQIYLDLFPSDKRLDEVVSYLCLERKILKLIAVRARSRPRVTLNWQRELKDSASRRVCGHPQMSMVSLDNRTTNR